MRYKSRTFSFFILALCAVLVAATYSFFRFIPRRGNPGKMNVTPPGSEITTPKVPGNHIVTPEVPEPQGQLPVPTVPVPLPIPSVQPTPVPRISPTPKQQIKKTTIPKNAIGSYETSMLDKHSGRKTNITLAANRINGYVVQPGQTFSFNETVGERSAEKGYLSAKIIVQGKYENGTGGGICQLSTTLYNAVKKSGLEVVERHPHSNKVGYVREGNDAAVNYGSLDFKFKNNRPYPVEIRAGIQYGRVYTHILKL